MDERYLTALFLFAAYLAVPMFLARKVVGASWTTIAIAYAVWLAILAAFALMNLAAGISLDESVSWPMILSLFFTLPAIPLIAFILRRTGRA